MEFTLFAGDRVYTVCPNYPGPVERSKLVDDLRSLITHVAATKYSFALQGLVPDDPDRQELLMLGAVDGNGTSAFGAFEIKRDFEGRAHLCNWRDLETYGWPFELFATALGSTMH